MGLRYIPAERLSNDGVKVSLVDALDYGVDSIAAGRRVVVAEFWDEEVMTANTTIGVDGFAGTSMLELHINVTALTLDTASGAIFHLQKRLADGATFADIAAWTTTTTGDKLLRVNAVAAGAVSDQTNLTLASGSTIDGPWYDRLRLSLAWGGGAGASSSATVSAHIVAIG